MSTALELASPAVVALTGDYERDLETAGRLRDAAEALQWAVGDYLLAMLERHAGTQRNLLQDVSARVGIAVKTLEQYALVARTFTADVRSSTLGYTHHYVAARADDPVAVVRQAETDGLTKRDTERLARGLPLGGEDTARAQSSATVQGASLEESVLESLSLAEAHLGRALETLGKPGMRVTVQVAQDVQGRLKAISVPYLAMEDIIKSEAGAYL